MSGNFITTILEKFDLKLPLLGKSELPVNIEASELVRLLCANMNRNLLSLR